jgi:hypothetical protein
MAMGRWTLHYRTPSDQSIQIFVAMDFDQALDEAGRKLQAGCRIVGIYDGHSINHTESQIKKKLKERQKRKG